MNTSEVWRKHHLWKATNGKQGKRANFSWMNLREADFSGMNLSRVNFRGADLRGTNLSRADLSGADLREADLRGTNLRDVNLKDVNLRYVLGDGEIVKSFFLYPYHVVIAGNVMAIGCEQHSIKKWMEFSNLRISRMDKDAVKFCKKWKPILLDIIKECQ